MNQEKEQNSEANMSEASDVDAVVSFWVVGAIKKEHDIDLFGKVQALDLTWADGMIGVIPVFESKKAARKYAGKKLSLFEIGVG